MYKQAVFSFSNILCQNLFDWEPTSDIDVQWTSMGPPNRPSSYPFRLYITTITISVFHCQQTDRNPMLTANRQRKGVIVLTFMIIYYLLPACNLPIPFFYCSTKVSYFVQWRILPDWTPAQIKTSSGTFLCSQKAKIFLDESARRLAAFYFCFLPPVGEFENNSDSLL